MDISVTTDYCISTGSPEEPVLLIAEAGFSHLHWCHHFSDDFLYSPCEMASIRSLLRDTGLALLDVHGSAGQEKSWSSPVEYERLAGIELVKNRARLFTELEGSGHLIMHLPVIQEHTTMEAQAVQRRRFESVLRSLDELAPWLQKEGVPLALENMSDDSWELLETAVSRYPMPWVGICYDSGHGNFPVSQLPQLQLNRHRLTALHLNDNDGRRDLHQPPRMGTVDWERLTDIIADSSHHGPPTFEITMRSTPFRVDNAAASSMVMASQPRENQLAFLRDARQRCETVAAAILQRRQTKTQP